MQPKKEHFTFSETDRRSWNLLGQKTEEEEHALIEWASSFEHCAVLHSNDFKYPGPGPHRYELLIAAGSVRQQSFVPGFFDVLEEFRTEVNDWIFGHFAYDLKNDLENLTTHHPDPVGFGNSTFFTPAHLFIKEKGQWYYAPHPENPGHFVQSLQKLNENLARFAQNRRSTFTGQTPFQLEPVEREEEYQQALATIKKHLQRGDIYEVNYCTAFEAHDVQIEPIGLFLALNADTQSPYASYYRIGASHLMGFSPERFLTTSGTSIWSQPIKGTASASSDPSALLNDPKEISENIMITDLVRNDLSRTAEKKSVTVLEKCGVYSFKHVHQLITTVFAKRKSDATTLDVIRNAFPMGSMTGAPKISAMQIIDRLEKRRRGLYSGSVGYISPNGDCDFNVVIRSLQYSEKTKRLHLNVGGAITIASDIQREYDEVLLKAQAIRNFLAPNDPSQ